MAFQLSTRDIMDSLADDGSRERVSELESLVGDAKEMRDLLENPTFQGIIKDIQRDMRTRFIDLIETDQELTALMNLLRRTIGIVNAANKAEEVLRQILNGEEE